MRNKIILLTAVAIFITASLPVRAQLSLPEQSYNFLKNFEGDEICAYLDDRKFRNGVGMIANEGSCINSQEDRYFYYLNDPQAKLCDKALTNLPISTTRKIILFSLCWNRGLHAMRTRGVMSAIDRGDFLAVCDLLLNWHRDEKPNKYKAGLQYRRYREAIVFGCVIGITGVK